MVILIHGIFFQCGLFKSGGISGIRKNSPPIFRFSGMIYTDRRNGSEGKLIGQMEDLIGKSELSEISIQPDKISFKKKYIDRKEPVSCEFVFLGDGTWAGECFGSFGRCPARCFVDDAPEDFFIPPFENL